MYDAILVPVDASPPSSAAAGRALDLALTSDADVHGLYVADPRASPISGTLEGEDVESLFLDDHTHPAADVIETADHLGLSATRETRVGVPCEEILDYAADVDADVVVMGTHGYTGLDRLLLGSTAERVVRRADRPVITVKDGGTAEE